MHKYYLILSVGLCVCLSVCLSLTTLAVIIIHDIVLLLWLLYTALRVFFLDGSHKRIDAIAAVSDRLYDFLDWIQTQASYKLFATSLLIIYEGDSNQPIKSPEQLIDVRWVDFAYACELKCEEQSQLTLDENVLFGLKNLIQFLERLKWIDRKSI